MNLRPLLNRAGDGSFKLPDDGFYQVVPLGNFPHYAGVLQVVDQEAATAILNSFTADKAKKEKVDDSGVLRVDYDHFSYDTDKSSKASGWIEELQNRTDGVYAKIRWTPEGKKAVEGGDFRYPSPVFLPSQVQRIDGKTIRPLRLDSVGLTNDPEMKGVRPLSNRAGGLLEELAPVLTPEPEPALINRAATLDLLSGEADVPAPRMATQEDLAN